MNIRIVTLIALLISSTLSFAEQSYTGENYFATTYIESKPTNAKRMKAAQEPELFSGIDKKQDYQRMHERGYELIGYSSFSAGNVPPELALPQAKKVGAEMVLLYSEQTGNRPASTQIQALKDAKAKGETLDPNLARNKPLGYEYFATYWAKIAPPTLGIHVKVPNEKEKPDGLSILVVLDQSPAEVAGLKKDDVLTKIGEQEVNNVDELNQAIKRYAGQEVTLEYKRERQFMTTKAKLN